jgi:hypothetical protein
MADTVKPPSPRRPRFWLRILLLFAFILAAPFGWFLIGRVRVEWRLRSAWAEAERLDPGWRYDELEAKRGPLPDAENGAAPIFEAIAHFPKRGYEPQWTQIPFAPDISKDERESWGWKFEHALFDLPGNVALNVQQEKALVGEVKDWSAALEAARRLKNYRAARFHYTIKNGHRLWEQASATRGIAELLHWDLLVHCHRQDWRAAVDSIQAACALGHMHAEEAVIVNQLLRHALYWTALTSSQRLVGQGEPPATLLSEIRQKLRLEVEHPHLIWIVRAARDDVEVMFQQLQSASLTDEEFAEIMWASGQDQKQANDGAAGGPATNGLFNQWRERASRDWKARHAELVESLNQWTFLAKLPIQEQFEAFKRRKAVGPAELDRTVQNVVESSFRLHAQLRATDAGLAVECYRQKHGRWPERLDDLTPECCDAVPIDMYTGKPLQYRRHKDGVVVYSVGPDEKDNGGKLRREADEPYVPFPEGLDFGIMLWDVAKRRAPPRPPLPLPQQWAAEH